MTALVQMKGSLIFFSSAKWHDVWFSTKDEEPMQEQTRERERKIVISSDVTRQAQSDSIELELIAFLIKLSRSSLFMSTLFQSHIPVCLSQTDCVIYVASTSAITLMQRDFSFNKIKI